MPSRNSIQSKPVVDRLRLVEGPPIQGHIVQHSDPYRLLVIDGVVVSCTPTEYFLLMRLLQQSGGYVAFAPLVECAFQSPLNRSTRRSLTQHMSRVRTKLWPFGFDVCCLTGYGYLLLSQPSEQAVHEQNQHLLPV
jgi:DNA-binding response OmpR family regulator